MGIIYRGARFLVVLLRSGPHAGKIAVIAEIIDHNRVRSGFFLDTDLP